MRRLRRCGCSQWRPSIAKRDQLADGRLPRFSSNALRSINNRGYRLSAKSLLYWITSDELFVGCCDWPTRVALQSLGFGSGGNKDDCFREWDLT